MSDVDVIIQVHTQGVQQIGNLSASLRNLSNTLRGVTVPMSKLDAHTKAVHKALGITSRGVDAHAKSIKQLAQNQKVLALESRRLKGDISNLKNAYALAGGQTTELGRSISKTTKELQIFSRTFRGMRLRALGSDFQNISLRMSKLGKDAQFVGRSLLINLTLPIATFARIGLQNFLAVEKQLVRITKVMEDLAPTMDVAAQKILGVSNATASMLSPAQQKQAERLVKNFKDMDAAITGLSTKFAVSKDLVASISADFGELGLTAQKNVNKLTQLTLEIEKLGNMDVGPAQDLTQALYFQSRRALELTGALKNVTTAREREQKAIDASITQMYLFNAIENATALTFKDLGDSFAEVSAMATSYGLSMTEAAAMLAPMKAAGLDVGASANSIKVSLQRLLAPTKQNVDTLKKLAAQYGVAENKQNEFLLSTKTGLVGLEAVVKVFDRIRNSSQGSEGALRLMSDLFEKRQGPRMYLAIEQLSDFNSELKLADQSYYKLKGTSQSAEVQLVKAAESATSGFSSFNTTIVPKTIRSFKDIGIIARIASAYAGQAIEIEPGKTKFITQADIKNAKAMRQATSDYIKEAKQARGIDIISEVKTEAGRAMMVELAGAANAQQVAQQELDRSLQTTGVAVDKIKNAFKLFAADIISRLAPAIEKVSKKVVEMYETWMSPEFDKTRQTIINLITSFGSFLAVMGPIILAIGTFQSVVGKVGLGIARFIPKLRNVEGEFVGLGRSIDIAKNSMNKLYESFIQLTGSRARPAALTPTPGGRVPQLPQAVTPAQRARMLNQARRDAMDAAGVTAAERRAAQAEFRRGTRAPATGHRARGSTGRMLPRNVVEALRIMEARELADVTPTPTGLLRSPSTGRMVSPTSGAASIRENLLAPVRRQESIFARSSYFEKAGIATDRMGTQFIRGGRRITEDQANRIAKGGIGSLVARTQIAGSAVGQRAMAPIRAIGRAGTAARAAMATAPSTGAGVVRGSVAATKSILRTTQAWQGASAALAAYNAKMLAFNAAPATGFKRLAIFITGFIRNMKLATIATKIFKMSLMFTGVGAIIAGIAAVVFLVIKNMDKIKGATKAWDALKRAFGLIKDAAMEIVRPIQDLFAQFGSGADEGEAAGQGIAKAFEGIAKAVEFVAGLIKMIVTKVIKPYLYGIVNIVMAVVQLFKGNWKDALKFLLAAVSQIAIGVISLFQMLAKAVISVMGGLAKGIVNLWFKGIVNGLYQAIVLALRGIVNLIGKIPGVNVITDPINNALKKVGGFISTLTSGVANTINKGIDGLGNVGKKAIDVVGDGLKNGLKKGADLGIKESSNKIKTDKKVPDAAEEQGDLAGEAIADAYGDAPIEGANDKIAGKIKEGIMDAVQKLQDYIAGRFASALKKFITDSVKALNKQKESALKVFDVQINTLMKLEKAEESLTKKKEYETNRRKLIDDATLRGEVYRRNRALAIYEGRIDDARILDLEEQQSAKESTQELATLDESRRKDLAKENLEALRDAINNAKELAGKFFDESVEKFQEAAEHITRIAPVTIEQYTAQLAELQTLTTQTADTNNLEFGKMFEKFATTIAEKMPNAVDDFGKALGAFSTPLDELVNLAMQKYGLGSEDEATVLGVTRKMADSVIGITLGMLTNIGDKFEGSATPVIEKFGDFKNDVMGHFTTLLEQTKTAFLEPYKKALDEADPVTVFKNAIIDGNAEILRSFQNMVDLNPDLMKKLAKSLDPAILKYIELKAAIDAANEAAGGSGGGGNIPNSSYDPETARFMRIRETAVANFRKSQQLQLDTFTRSLGVEDVVGLIGSSNLGRFTQGRTLPSPKRMPIERAEGGPVSKDAAFRSTPYGISGFLNAPEQQGIPAILHGGEFVINADAVRRIGLGALAKLNDPRIPKFKKGGFVGKIGTEDQISISKEKTKQLLGYTADMLERKITPPTLDVKKQPIIKNNDGTVSTVRSIGVGTNSGVVVLPTVDRKLNKIVNPQTAINNYIKSGEHLGIYPNEKIANLAAQAISRNEANRIVPAMQRDVANAIGTTNYKRFAENIDLQITDAKKYEKQIRLNAKGDIYKGASASLKRLNDATTKPTADITGGTTYNADQLKNLFIPFGYAKQEINTLGVSGKKYDPIFRIVKSGTPNPNSFIPDVYKENQNNTPIAQFWRAFSEGGGSFDSAKTMIAMAGPALIQGVGTLAVETAKSFGRTLSGKNVKTLLSSDASLTERGIAITEDLLNIGSVFVPMLRGGSAALENFATRGIVKQIEKQAAKELLEFGGKEAFYNYLVSSGIGSTTTEASTLFKAMILQKRFVANSLMDIESQAIRNVVGKPTKDLVPDLISNIRSHYLRQSSIDIGSMGSGITKSIGAGTGNVLKPSTVRELMGASGSSILKPLIKTQLALGAGDTTGRFLPESLFNLRLNNPITVRTGEKTVLGTSRLDRDLTKTTGKWVRGWLEDITAHANATQTGFLLEGDYFESLPGLLGGNPVGFGFNIGSPENVKKAFPMLPKDTALVQAQPFEILDTALGVLHGGGGLPLRDLLNSMEGARFKTGMITDRFSPSQVNERAYGFVYDYAHAQAAPNSIHKYLEMQKKWLEKLERDLLFYKENPQYGVKTVDDLWKDFVAYNDVFEGLSLDQFNSFIGKIPRFGENLTPQQIDYIALNAANGNAEAKQMFDQLSGFGKDVRKMHIDSIARGVEKRTFDERLNLGNTFFIREELGEFPMFKLQPDGSMTLHSRSSLTHDPNTRRAIDRHTIHGALNHIVHGGTLGGRPNVTGATFITARVEDILKYNPGSLNTLLGYDTNFVAPPFGSIRIPAGKFNLFKESMETFQTYPGMRDPYIDSIMQSMYRQKNRLESITSWDQWQIMKGQERVYTREYASKLKKEIEDRMILESFYKSSIIGNPMGVDLNEFLQPVMHGNPRGSKTMDFYNYMAGVEGRDSSSLIRDLDEFLYNQQAKYVTDIREGMYGQYLHDYKKVLEYYEKLYPELVDKFNESYTSRPIYEMIDAAHPEMSGSAGINTIQKTVTRDALRKKIFGSIEEGNYGAPAVRASMQEIDADSQMAFNRIGLSLPDPVIPVFHPDMYAAIGNELPQGSFSQTGIYSIPHLTQVGRNQILRNFASDAVWIQDFLGYFPGKFTRLKTVAQRPWEQIVEKAYIPPDFSMSDLLNRLEKEKELVALKKTKSALSELELVPQTGSLPQLNIASGITGVLDPVLQAKRAAVLQMRGMGGGGAFFNDIPVPRVPLNIPNNNSSQEMLDILFQENNSLALFQSLGRLNARVKSNVSMTPNEAFIVDEFTGAFNQILNLRLLDLHNDPIALDAYLQNILKMSINRPGPGVGIPLPFGEGTTPLLESLKANGFEAVFTYFDDVLNNPEIQQIVDMLLRDFAKTHKKLSLSVPDDTTVFRGLVLPQPSGDPFRYLRHLYAKGSMLPPHYVSTSTNPYVAGNFTGAAGHVNLLEQITLPKGTEVLAPAHWGVGLQNEKELILPPTYRLKIDDMEQAGVLHRIFATAVKTAGVALPIAGAGMMLSDQEKALADFSKNQNPITVDRMEEKIEKFYSSINQLKEFIAAGESINALDPYSAWAKPGAPGMIMPGMTSMKIGEIIKSAQGHAVGKYQNMPPYLLQRAKVAGFNIGTVFTPDVQEAIMLSTLMSSPQDAGIGLTSLFNNRIGTNTAVDRIANMWRSMSGTEGMYVGGRGNPTGFDPSRKDLVIKSLLEQMMLSYPGFKKGGFVKGATSKAIPATLHGGEYVLNAKAVNALGIPTLNALNMINPSNRKKPDPDPDHPSRRKIPPSKEVQRHTEQNYDPKTGRYIGALPRPGATPRPPRRPTIPMPPPLPKPGDPQWNMQIPNLAMGGMRFSPPITRTSTIQAPVTNNMSTVNIQVENFIGQEEWFNSMMKEYNVNVLPKNQKLAGLEQRKFTSYNGINQGM